MARVAESNLRDDVRRRLQLVRLGDAVVIAVLPEQQATESLVLLRQFGGVVGSQGRKGREPIRVAVYRPITKQLLATT